VKRNLCNSLIIRALKQQNTSEIINSNTVDVTVKTAEDEGAATYK
jgi:hypothetical protein